MGHSRNSLRIHRLRATFIALYMPFTHTCTCCSYVLGDVLPLEVVGTYIQGGVCMVQLTAQEVILRVSLTKASNERATQSV